MCGIVGVLVGDEDANVNQQICDGGYGNSVPWKTFALSRNNPSLGRSCSITALTVLQHRGQGIEQLIVIVGSLTVLHSLARRTLNSDAAGMVTTSSRPGSHLELRKDNGLVKEVFSEDHMRALVGNIGSAVCRLNSL
jgi:glutamine phosphoribosylpyrophosphate amidotransferase